MIYAEYAKKVAKMLRIESSEKLEEIYGDLILECFEAKDTVDACCKYCTFEDEDYYDDKEDDLVN